MERPLERLLERLNERARDPKRATDEAQGEVAAPPLTTEQWADVERRLGFTLPELLREIYQTVGNGGFGPGYGLFGLPTSAKNEDESIVGQYLKLRQLQTAPAWPTGLLPLCDWGCNIASYIDCIHSDSPIIRLDPNMPKGDVATRVPLPLHFDRAAQIEDACWVEAPSLALWLDAWADGKPLFYAAYGESGEDSDEDMDEDDFEEEDE